eukprot:Hpha_TRINITY_DN27368_c0_g1::TRINITY_DN27368_c0_g1_i1::g.663::m.663
MENGRFRCQWLVLLGVVAGSGISVGEPTQAPSSAPTTAANLRSIAGPFPLTAVLLAEGVVKASVHAPFKEVTGAEVVAAFPTGVAVSLAGLPGMPAVVVTPVDQPVATNATERQMLVVSMTVRLDLAAVLSDISKSKTMLALLIARALSANFAQIKGLRIRNSNGGTFGREGVALEQATATLQFTVCFQVGCVGAGNVLLPVFPERTLPGLQELFERGPRQVSMGDIRGILRPGRPLRGQASGDLPLLTMEIAPGGIPVKSDTPPDRVGFKTEVLLSDANYALRWPGKFKSVYQLAVANELLLNPYQVTGIVVTSATGLVWGRRGSPAGEVQTITVYQEVCYGLCASNKPPDEQDDSDSSGVVILVFAVLGPLAVAGLVIVVAHMVCSAEENDEGAEEGEEAEGKGDGSPVASPPTAGSPASGGWGSPTRRYDV